MNSWSQRLVSPAAAVVVLAAFWGLLCAGAWNKSITYDELVHASAGVTYWKYNDYRLNPENGNLPQRIAAIPLVTGRFPLPPPDSRSWVATDEWNFGDQWFNRMGNDTVGMLHRGRAFAASIAVGMAALVWACSRRIFGPAGAMLSLLLCVLDPTVLANGPLIASDTAAAAFFLAATWAWWLMLHRFTPGRIALSCLAMGGLFVSKMSAPLILPIVLALTLARLAEGQPLPAGVRRVREVLGRGRQARVFALGAALHVAAVCGIVWGFYGFRFSMFAADQKGAEMRGEIWGSIAGQKSLPDIVGRLGLSSGAETQALKIVDSLHAPQIGWNSVSDLAVNGIKTELLTDAQSRRFDKLIASPPTPVTERLLLFLRRHEILPEAYLFGYLHAWRFSQLRSTFFNGDFGSFGSFWFFPYSFLVKTPLPFLAILGTAAAAGIAIFRSRKRGRNGAPGFWKNGYEMLPFGMLIAVYGTAILSSRLNIGHRHMLALYPPLFVLGGAAIHWARQARWLLPSLVGLLAIETGLRFPNYISYFNGIVSPTKGYQHFVDSTIDWGQDLPGVRAYIDSRPSGAPFYLAYFGNGDPATYGIAATFLRSNPGRFMKVVPPVVAQKIDGTRAPAEIDRLNREFPDYDAMGTAGIQGALYAILVRKPAALRLRGGTYFISATMLQSSWDDDQESNYQGYRKLMAPLLGTDVQARRDAIQSADMDRWLRIQQSYNVLVGARISAYLRRYLPDDDVGHSILIYRVTDADIDRILDGPPPSSGPLYDHRLHTP